MGTDLLPFDEVTALVATASALGILLVAPLYLSQRRDIQRLREWMQQNPSYAASEVAKSEQLLDRAELELEQIYAERGVPFTTGTQEHPVHVTSERPALTQVTMERAALEPHPRWHRFGRLATQPRWMAVVALAALTVSVAGVIGVQQILVDDDRGAAPGTSEPDGISVAVLNTTSAGGIGGRVSREIVASGYLAGGVQTFVREADQSVVMHQPGGKRAAKRIAGQLEIGAVQRIDLEVEEAVPEADVVVILGQDRVGG
ncbi:MAG: LytR C-terminal domain-containing protein [Actinomycetota bacterium]|nr:LytR C-terminal domain-containing protein [Actinomycetota bacterium]